jgi:hypothetical protein
VSPPICRNSTPSACNNLTRRRCNAIRGLKSTGLSTHLIAETGRQLLIQLLGWPCSTACCCVGRWPDALFGTSTWADSLAIWQLHAGRLPGLVRLTLATTL